MGKYKYIFLYLILLILYSSCSSTKNTAGTRWYHSFNTRYNVYFNGDMAYQESLKSQQEGYKENYTETILMFPVSSLPKDKTKPGGPFDKAIEKSVKAIKTHSIQTKPERKSGKRNDPKYQDWINRTEYNPFLHNAWMLMAKSQFHNGDFLQAASSFSYIARIYSTQPEIGLTAKLWQARSYSELEWFYEAEDILNKTGQSLVDDKQKNFYATVYADFLIKQKKYRESIPYLETAIKAEKNKLQKTREKYLLGQIYSSLGERELAYNTFGEVSSANAPYILEFSAKIRQTEVYTGSDTSKVTKQLRSMAKSSKNKDYLDQLYYALGNIYMSIPDTVKAIDSYELGVEKSVQQGIDKTLNQIQLGDIYFNQKKFVKAQPNYSESLSQLKKEDAAYPRVSKRSEILDELVIHIVAVELQDSLLRLSNMSEGEKLNVINKIIAELKKKEEEEQKNKEREDYMAERENTRAEMGVSRPMPGIVAPPQDENLFYFYSTQAVTQGKAAFQQKWGQRKLEDDWRRRNKTNPMVDAFGEEEISQEDNNQNEENINDENELADNSTQEPIEMSNDPHDPQYYLQQIPSTPEQINAANLIIADGLYNMGIIYKDRLEDLDLALETFNTLDTRFPDNENKLMAYYHTYLIYLKIGDTAMANLYKQKIRSEFPESKYAIAMADPNYEYNMKMLYIIPDSLYQETFEAYVNGNVNKVRSNYTEMKTKFNQSNLMPKFIFLNALTYVQTNDAEEFKNQLRELINLYPDADVSVLAGEMMKGFQRGLILSASGDNMLARGNLFNIRFGGLDGEIPENIADITFLPETNTPYMLLMIYPQGTINDNLLLYTVASFNFGNFTVNVFDLEKTTMGNVGLLQIKGFKNFQEILQYMQMIYAPEGFANGLEKAVLIVPISLINYEILMKGKSMEEYMQFFEENFGKDNQNMIERWKLQQEEELTDSLDKEEEEILEHIDETLEQDESGNTEAKDTLNQESGKEETPIKEEVSSESETQAEEEEKTNNSNEIVTGDLIVPEKQEPDSVKVPTLSELEQQRIEEKMNEIGDKTEDVLNQTSETLDNVNKTVDEIMADPVRGIQNLFKKKKTNSVDEYVKEQERLDKEKQKELKKQKEAEEKALRELAKQKEKEQKELEKEKKREEEELAKQKKAEEKAKIDEKKRIQKEKEDARKQREKDRKEALKIKEQDRKEREKVKEEARKQREKEKKEAQKIREEERKRRAKEKENARKAREQEKKETQKQRSQERSSVRRK